MKTDSNHIYVCQACKDEGVDGYSLYVPCHRFSLYEHHDLKQFEEHLELAVDSEGQVTISVPPKYVQVNQLYTMYTKPIDLTKDLPLSEFGPESMTPITVDTVLPDGAVLVAIREVNYGPPTVATVATDKLNVALRMAAKAYSELSPQHQDGYGNPCFAITLLLHFDYFTEYDVESDKPGDEAKSPYYRPCELCSYDRDDIRYRLAPVVVGGH